MVGVIACAVWYGLAGGFFFEVFVVKVVKVVVGLDPNPNPNSRCTREHTVQYTRTTTRLQGEIASTARQHKVPGNPVYGLSGYYQTSLHPHHHPSLFFFVAIAVER